MTLDGPSPAGSAGPQPIRQPTAIDSWLDELSTQVVPGGVAAAALASAMGAALIIKAARITLQRQALEDVECRAVEALVELSSTQKGLLRGLVQADVEAYRSLLRTRASQTPPTARDSAWRGVLEIPLQLAEACRLLLDRVPHLVPLCPPEVRPDLLVGQRLLEVGQHAGQAAAEHNLQAWADDPHAGSPPWAQPRSQTSSPGA
jgi:formiminotetrahydrofolate cyclodeaminase